jgi:HSP20 family protein
MTLVRWEPMREIDAVRREMDRLLGDFMSTADRDYFDRSSFIPAVELAETDDAVILKLEIPGIAAEDLDIQATSESVTIQGERKLEKTVEGENYNRSEFRYGKFRRVVPLPVRVQNTASQASYRDGLLSLTLPKAEEEKNKVVKVNIEAA